MADKVMRRGLEQNTKMFPQCFDAVLIFTNITKIKHQKVFISASQPFPPLFASHYEHSPPLLVEQDHLCETEISSSERANNFSKKSILE
jgi:hypothetical protein